MSLPVTKVYGTLDGVAPPEKIESNRHLLPDHARFVDIPGGNHSQFGHYGHQLLDHRAEVGREYQQGIAREVLKGALQRARAAAR